MTIEEYELAVEEAIEERELRIWEIYDLRLLLKFARQCGTVSNLDVLFLDWAGRPAHGPVVDLRNGKVKKPLAKQSRLF